MDNYPSSPHLFWPLSFHSTCTKMYSLPSATLLSLWRKTKFKMKYEKLSIRLQEVGEFVPQDAVLLDIGSDHAYLPIQLVRMGRIKSAIAGEVVQGPYDSAKSNVAAFGLSDSITVRLASGLAAFDPEIEDRKSTRLNSSHQLISYADF